MTKAAFPNLFTPIRSVLELKNRIVHSPHGAESEDTHSFLSDPWAA